MKQYSYFALFQRTGLQQKSETPAADDFASLLPDALRSAAEESGRVMNDVIVKNGSILRGRLTHFLSTPLRSDKDEIMSLITESISGSVAQLNAAPDVGGVDHTIWSVIDPQDVPLQRQMVGVLKRLLKNGRAMLIDAGCQFGKNSGEPLVLFVSFDAIPTGITVKSAIETLSKKTSMPTVNEALSTFLIDLRPENGPVKKNSIMIDFDIDGEGIHHRLRQRLPVLQEQFGIKQFSLTKQLFRSSLGARYQIRFTADLNAHPLGSMILSLIGDDEELEDAITARGSLVVLEQRP